MATSKLSPSNSRGFSCTSSPDFMLKTRTSKSTDRLRDVWNLRVDGKVGESVRTNFMVTKYSLPARLTAPKEKRQEQVLKSLRNQKIDTFLHRFSSPQDAQPAKAQRRGVMGWKLSMSRPTTKLRYYPKACSPTQLPRRGVREGQELYLQYLQFKHRRAESSV